MKAGTKEVPAVARAACDIRMLSSAGRSRLGEGPSAALLKAPHLGRSVGEGLTVAVCLSRSSSRCSRQ